MSVDIGELVRVVLEFTAPGASNAQNVFIYKLEDQDVDEGDLISDVGTYFSGHYLADWQDLAAEAAQAINIYFDVLNNDGTVNRNIGQTALAVDGGEAFQVNSAAVSAFAYVPTTRIKSLLKKFVPFLAESVITDGTLTAGALATMVLLLLDLSDQIAISGGGNLQPGIRSTTDDTFYPTIGGGYITDIPAYQRRRKQNVGS